MSYDRRKVLRALASHGFIIVREGGRHTIVRSPTGQTVAIPRHRELNRLTVRGIAEDAGVECNAFRKDIG